MEDITAIVRDYEALSKRSDGIDIETNKERVKSISKELKRTVNAYGLSSLSAIQIGEPVRMFAINFRGDIRIFVNPLIVEANGFELSEETCSSIPNKTYLVPRSVDITLNYQTTSGRMRSHKFIGMAAKTVLHCMDHLDGVLLSDIGLEIDDDYRNASEEEKVEVIDAYMDAIKNASTRLNEEIQEDEDLRKMSDAVDFMQKVQRGEVKVIKEQITLKRDGEQSSEDTADTGQEGV